MNINYQMLKLKKSQRSFTFLKKKLKHPALGDFPL